MTIIHKENRVLVYTRSIYNDLDRQHNVSIPFAIFSHNNIVNVTC